MATIQKIDIQNCLNKIIDPHHGLDLITAKVVKTINIEGANVEVAIELGYPARDYLPLLKAEAEQALHSIEGIGAVNVTAKTTIVAHSVQQTLQPVPGVKNIIAVASGKGGVGKSTTSVNLALALAAEGAQVGILDADIYGPSIPTMLNLSGSPESQDNKTMLPKVSYGLQANSIGFLVDPDQAIIWRGPMVTGALLQLFKETLWDNLDYLIIDLPPGTGDIQLTLAQQIPVSGAVIVTTPQDIALLDAQRGLKMFEKVNIPVLGVIENMSMHICSNCGHSEAIFGTGGGETLSTKYNVELLGALPLDINIRNQADIGKPTVIADPNSQTTEIYRLIARKMTAQLALRGKDYSRKFANIVVQTA